MIKPNFIIGGTSAGGTSFLTAAMIQHPDIYISKRMRPEPHYFYKSWEYQKGFQYYLDTWFSEYAGQKAIGERSSSYIFGGETVAEKIYKDLPEVKLIFTFRNPIERTWANYRVTVIQGLEDLSFEDALKNEKERVKNQKGIWKEIQPYNYTGRGFYAEQLKGFLKYFPMEQMILIKSEDMGKKPQHFFEKVFAFLDVDTNFFPVEPPNFTSLSVKDPKLQMELRDYFQNRFDEFIETVRRKEDPFLLSKSVEDEKNINLLINNLKSEKESMSVWANEYLKDVFRNDILELKNLVPFDISDWL